MNNETSGEIVGFKGTDWVAQRLGYSESTIRRMAELKQLPAYKLPSGLWRFDPRAFEAWLASRSNQHEGQPA